MRTPSPFKGEGWSEGKTRELAASRESSPPPNLSPTWGRGVCKHALNTRAYSAIKLTGMALPVCCLVLLVVGLTAPSIHAQSRTDKGAAGDVICRWSFEQDSKDSAFDHVGQKKDSVFGSVEYVQGVSGKAIKLDGFRSYIKRDQNTAEAQDAFTVEAWVALASYPWSWSPVLDCASAKTRGYFFGIGPEGQVRFQIAAGSIWHQTTTLKQVPLRKWTNIAAVFEPNKKITIFLNGQKAASAEIDGQYIPSPAWRGGSLTIGRNNQPQTWNEYQLTTDNVYFFLDGLLDEITLSGKAKTEEQISGEYASVNNLPAPALSDRSRLPTGPVGSGSFGAFYTRLNYYKEWDDLWRVGEMPDIFVRFDQSPVQLVFWRGTSFVPCWVTENGTWYTNEWLETWGRDVVSCAEPIMDRYCQYSHVRLIEYTDARVVIHWRYALSDAFYQFAAVGDDGRGEWCDEYHVIYPDQVGVRKMELHYSKPERKHDWVEQIVVLPPGKHPDDVIERAGISLVNMSGDVKQYSWHDPDLKVEMPEPGGANISVARLKSKYRPFIIVSPRPVKTVEGTWDSPFFRTYAAKMAKGLRQDPVPSVYGWWDHWPVAQVPGDGRWVITPDRPSHFTLTTFVQWEDYRYTPRTRTRIMLQGVTDKKADQLVPLAKSWLQAPVMQITGDAYGGGGYDPAERAYRIEKASPGRTPCTFVLQATEESPLVNPAIIITNWGGRLSTLFIDGKPVKQGKDFRQGIRKGPTGEDLILWFRMDRRQPVTMKLE